VSRLHHQQRRKSQRDRSRAGSLNLVSLMDIFTILVFFLMVNSSDVEILETSAAIKLPDSIAEQRPEERLVIQVSQEALIVQGRQVADLTDLADDPAPEIARLRDALLDYVSAAEAVPEGGFQVTIMGDHELPYWLLKRIMSTCQGADFARISLAVNYVEREA